MNKLLACILALLFCASCLPGGSSYSKPSNDATIYNSQWRVKAHIKDGRIYDAKWRPVGRIKETGR